MVIIGPSDPLGVPAVQGEKPCAPDSLTANVTVGIGPGTIVLTWTDTKNNTGIDKYNVYCSTTQGGPYQSGEFVAQVIDGTNSYTGSGLADGTYYYVVKGELGVVGTDGDESNASPEASGTVVLPQCSNGMDDDGDLLIDFARS